MVCQSLVFHMGFMYLTNFPVWGVSWNILGQMSQDYCWNHLFPPACIMLNLTFCMHVVMLTLVPEWTVVINAAQICWLTDFVMLNPKQAGLDIPASVMWYSIYVMWWRSPSPWISFLGFNSISIMLLPSSFALSWRRTSVTRTCWNWVLQLRAETSKKLKRSLVHMLIHLTTSTL